MCSYLILIANSCYVDNWTLIVRSFTDSLIMGLVVGIFVGVILLFLKK
jgi:uncharacterized membrane-anchored protein YhcB (DUF1043 family)